MIHFYYPYISIVNITHIELVAKKHHAQSQRCSTFQNSLFHISVVIPGGVNVESSQDDICINIYTQHLWVYSLIKARAFMSFVQREVKNIFPVCISFGTPVSSLKST